MSLKSKVGFAVSNLSTTIEKFIEDPAVLGTYIVDTNRTLSSQEIAEVLHQDEAVASYAVTATGGGEGYVVIAAGNGEAFTPEEEPVAMHIFRVGGGLYRGELKPLVAGNPLSENVTVQHTGDFAGDPGDFEFQWRKAAPVNGLPPAVTAFQAGIVSTTALEWDISEAFDPTPITLPNDLEIFDVAQTRAAQELQLTASVDISAALDSSSAKLDTLYASILMEEADGITVTVNGNPVITYRSGNTTTDSAVASGLSSEVESQLPPVGDGYLTFEIPLGDLKLDGDDIFELGYNTVAAPGTPSRLDFRLAFVEEIDISSAGYLPLTNSEVGKNRHLVAGAGIDTLGDNYYIMRYRPLEGHSLYPAGGFLDASSGWSDWTRPGLVEGWIKRVLAGINPFNQKLSDFFENAIDTDVSIISQAGTRWEGDIALTLDAVADAGLIETYETVLKRGIDLSIDGTPEIDYGPANDALLLAAGYLNDLYMALGNEAFADASNPTIAFDGQPINSIAESSIASGFDDVFKNTATSRFAFEGQVASLIDEELALLRGRDDFLQPSIEVAPAYNRLFWNYTRGIDAGEVFYALNYNITEKDDDSADGKVDAEDAQRIFPQAHGDAYGHYLTALKNYYRLLTDEQFTWGTRIEAVNVLGQPVSIDYLDERKFAAAAVATARTANQVLSLERRKAEETADLAGWEHLSDERENDRTNRTRRWGVTEWAARAGQGSYFHWVVANSILPAEDTVNEGIQKIDRTTIPELDSLAATGNSIQRQLDAANARVNPLGLTDDDLLFDISPVALENGDTHFEQVYDRAVSALDNAFEVFDRATGSTRLLRSLENQNQDLSNAVIDQERAYLDQLAAIYGTPYPGDIGAGKTYPQGYEGPDLYRYFFIDRPFEIFAEDELFSTSANGGQTFSLLVENDAAVRSLQTASSTNNAFNLGQGAFFINGTDPSGEDQSFAVDYTLNIDQGPYQIQSDPSAGTRARTGSTQQALAQVRLAEEQLYAGLDSMDDARESLVAQLERIELDLKSEDAIDQIEVDLETQALANKIINEGLNLLFNAFKTGKETLEQSVYAVRESLPQVSGLASDVTSGARAALLASRLTGEAPLTAGQKGVKYAQKAIEVSFAILENSLNARIADHEEDIEFRAFVAELQELYEDSLSEFRTVDALSIAYIRAIEDYQNTLTDGLDVLAERETFRKRAAAAVQGYRTRDVAFRAFRTEALEQYQTLLDWAAKYTYLAAQAYDYETGLLGSDAGRQFLGEIVSSRALGVLGEDGQPTFRRQRKRGSRFIWPPREIERGLGRRRRPPRLQQPGSKRHYLLAPSRTLPDPGW